MVSKIITQMRTDFNNKAIVDSGVSVTRTPITKTISGNFGDEILTDGTPETIKVFIVKKNTKWFVEHAGEFEGADGMMLVKHDQTVNKNDKITYLSRDYRVAEVLERTAGEGAVIYKVCPLYLFE
jgi:hypothetical protein